MGYLEDKILNSLVWWPYNDDILWFGNTWKRHLKSFLKIINSCHPTIKFTALYSLDKVKLLDVEVIRSGNKLLTDLYIKPTDTHQYLEFSSCHVYHSKKSIPYSQALRFNRICLENMFLDNRCNQLECWLKDRGYNEKVVRQQILKPWNLRRKIYLTKILKLRGEKNLSLVLLTTQPIRNLNIFYQILTCC